MDDAERPLFTSAEWVVACRELGPTLEFFTEELGFRLDMIFPADAPRVASISGGGIRLRLETGDASNGGRLRLIAPGDGPGTTAVAPNGTRIEFVPRRASRDVPPIEPRLLVSRNVEREWGSGRAGMRYRDLLPDRLGGSVIASHIRIPQGGPVPDYVHHHDVRFQVIFCYRGWVKVVYEDQGPPIVMRAGDGVLQPPHIRHRVLEASAGLEVIEVASPAEHETHVDHDMTLPTGKTEPGRDFGGQRFVFHEAARASWAPWRVAGFEARDTGIGEATGGIGGVHVVRPSGTAGTARIRHDAEFVLNVVLSGGLTVTTGGSARRLTAGDAIAIPPGEVYAYEGPTHDLEVLEISMPADFRTTQAG